MLEASFGDLGWNYDPDQARWQTRELPLARRHCDRRVRVGPVMLSAEPFSDPKRLDAAAAACAKVAQIPLVSTDVPNVEILPRRNKAGEMFLFVINLSAREVREGELARGHFESVTELSGECRPAIPVVHEGHTTRDAVPLSPGTAVFLRLGRPIPLTRGLPRAHDSLRL